MMSRLVKSVIVSGKQYARLPILNWPLKSVHQRSLGCCGVERYPAIEVNFRRRRLRRFTSPCRSRTQCTVLMAGGLMLGYRRAISSLIFGAPHFGFSFFSRTISRSTSKGVRFGWECGARLQFWIPALPLSW